MGPKRHVPVLLDEVIESLKLYPGAHVIDCTVGDGGHSEKILEATTPEGRLIAIDADPESLLRSKQRLYPFDGRVTFVRENFEKLEEIVKEHPIGSIHGVLMDFGWSSPQFSERNRGFSFEGDEPLDMRYAAGKDNKQSAEDFINNESIEEIERVFATYGEERFANEVAWQIGEKRKKEKISTTKQLVDLILEVYRKKLNTEKEIPWIGGIHPATRIFQSIRIAVNNELGVIEDVLPQAVEVLQSGGRLAVITFHSLEDRIVKHFFKSIKDKSIHIITKKPIVCSNAEAKENPRARSAKLRVIEKI
ncbi:MAG: 16S rRNA (cytosine(1402)-N(4))-methyltransferase RsmH [Candidatus Magasanikbacteria bacterium]|jgi:16S rRNA (cytosine1402-N4)-methyltransferase|nr:16S rRNA (cytosine(1402)-N(4))-methyltransferase RsmH [Candidatus Magasanikbacteria bacterium]MBT4221074.1 16S rRNA (cytosine(1402)-N(4))-methyltransferase RsmH [Candidatus Magasanikbacteria bacterium]MBT4350582.1 16S rRNA (cytosine(1402)-N(4))-methyltransferase RsmH [Candidatus Magasanikbacteria bacterium]MBT4542119.1 16S rRNA (cytosine(1402)-N(4))-methyltransferase RsmH [Candidatus Magasanikbacteria bacterium]MBT6253241.1 16S rRNA (cytosine(1402)-N(4))-methyltransferase RsmH [Candidatus Ma